MIILRQKIFFNYSGYSPEDIAKIKAARREQAKRLLADRAVAQRRMQNSNDFSKRGAEKKIQELEGLGLGNRNTGQVRQSIIQQHQSNVNRNYQARNDAYTNALKDSDKFKKQLDKQFKREKTLPTTTNPNSNPYNTANLGTTYKKPNNTTQSTALVSQNNSNPVQKQGIGLGGKVAIGAGVAAAGYGAYRLLKSRKEKNEVEERQQGGY